MSLARGRPEPLTLRWCGCGKASRTADSDSLLCQKRMAVRGMPMPVAIAASRTAPGGLQNTAVQVYVSSRRGVGVGAVQRDRGLVDLSSIEI